MSVVCRTGMRAATEDKSGPVAWQDTAVSFYPVVVCVCMHVCVFACDCFHPRRDSVVVLSTLWPICVMDLKHSYWKFCLQFMISLSWGRCLMLECMQTANGNGLLMKKSKACRNKKLNPYRELHNDRNWFSQFWWCTKTELVHIWNIYISQSPLERDEKKALYQDLFFLLLFEYNLFEIFPMNMCHLKVYRSTCNVGADVFSLWFVCVLPEAACYILTSADQLFHTFGA